MESFLNSLFCQKASIIAKTHFERRGGNLGKMGKVFCCDIVKMGNVFAVTTIKVAS